MRKRGAAVPPVVEPRLSPSAEVALLCNSRGSEPTVSARWARVRHLVRQHESPSGDDATLFVLLAVERVLPVANEAERRTAHRHLVAIGSRTDLPKEIRRAMWRLLIRPGNGQRLADRLLPPTLISSDLYESGAGIHPVV